MLRVIYNPVAGRNGRRGIDRVREVLDRRNVPFEIAAATGPGDASALAAEAAGAGCETVAVVGGDGTVNEAANGLAGTGTRLLAVSGTIASVLGAELGLPKGVEECLALLDTGRTVEIPLGIAEGRYFVFMASAGFDAEVVERMDSRQRNLFGTAAYISVGARHLLRPQPMLWMEFPGRERIDAQLVILCRGRMYGNTTMCPDGRLDAKTFHVIALRRPGRLSILRFALRALRGTHLGSPDVLVREADTLLVRCAIRSAAQVDGDYLGPLPVRFSMSGKTLRLVVPPGGPGSSASRVSTRIVPS